MTKKLVVPALMLAMAAFGCSSSTTSSGTGGSGGHGTGGAGGHGTGGTAVGGHSGGTSGGGTSGGGTSGGGTSGGGTSGGGTSGGGTSGGGTSGGGTSGGGTSGGGTSGGGTSGGGHPGGGAGGTGIQVMANCKTTSSTADALAPDVFCMNLLANCTNLPAGYTTDQECRDSYMMGVAAKKQCQSYHLCWGVEGQGPSGGGIPATHCPHAEGVSMCTQTQ